METIGLILLLYSTTALCGFKILVHVARLVKVPKTIFIVLHVDPGHSLRPKIIPAFPVLSVTTSVALAILIVTDAMPENILPA